MGSGGARSFGGSWSGGVRSFGGRNWSGGARRVGGRSFDGCFGGGCGSEINLETSILEYAVHLQT